MNNEHAFLTYSIVKENDLHTGYSLDPKGLNNIEIQQAINGYSTQKDMLERENIRLNKLVDELMNSLNYYKEFKYKYDEKYSSGY